MTNQIINPRDNTITLAESWNDLIADFLLNLDRKPSTKETYKKSEKEKGSDPKKGQSNLKALNNTGIQL